MVYYMSQEQWVPLPQQQGKPANPVGTFTLFLWNQGKAPARETHVGHFSTLPAHNVYPDIPRQMTATPGGGNAIRFNAIPPKVLVSISYLYALPLTQATIVSYVGSEDGPAKHIPVMLQRIFPKWFNNIVLALMLAGLWVLVNAIWSLARFLWISYYVGK